MKKARSKRAPRAIRSTGRRPSRRSATPLVSAPSAPRRRIRLVAAVKPANSASRWTRVYGDAREPQRLVPRLDAPVLQGEGAAFALPAEFPEDFGKQPAQAIRLVAEARVGMQGSTKPRGRTVDARRLPASIELRIRYIISFSDQYARAPARYGVLVRRMMRNGKSPVPVGACDRIGW
jgi:hypothetical protein